MSSPARLGSPPNWVAKLTWSVPVDSQSWVVPTKGCHHLTRRKFGNFERTKYLGSLKIPDPRVPGNFHLVDGHRQVIQLNFFLCEVCQHRRFQHRIQLQAFKTRLNFNRSFSAWRASIFKVAAFFFLRPSPNWTCSDLKCRLSLSVQGPHFPEHGQVTVASRMSA